MTGRNLLLTTAMAALLAACSDRPAETQDGPPRNPFLADSPMAMTHFNPGQTDSLPWAGPTGTFDVSADRLLRVPGALVNLTVQQAAEYPDGQQVVFAANNNRVAKILVSDNQFEMVAEYQIEGQPYLSADEVNALGTALNGMEDEASLLAYANANYAGYVEQVVARAAIYNVLDRDGTFFTVANDQIIALADAEPGNPRSALELQRTFALPTEYFNPTLEQPDAIMGLNLTYDGMLVMVTIGGVVALVDREFENPPIIYRLPDGEQVTNSIAIDEDGGIYVLSNTHMRKLVWDGNELHTDSHGAWSSPYDSFAGDLGGVSLGNGSGSTPSLMGFGEGEDELVVITDGSLVMNVVAFWRNEIPEDFEQQEGTQSRRIAGQMRVTFGRDDLERAQSEQSVVVSGYDAVVVNNTLPDPLPTMLENVLVSGVHREGPTGVEKFRWDSTANHWIRAWANPDVASPTTVPMISQGSNQVYVNGFVDGRWEMTGLDLDSGEAVTHVRLGTGQEYNGAYSVISMLEDGDIVLGGLLGPIRIDLNGESAGEE